MVCAPLDVDENTISGDGPQDGDETHESHLRSVGDVVKHGLAREEAPDPEPIQSARKLVLTPYLDGVRPAEAVQSAVRLPNLRGDPPSRPARVGTGGDDVVEGDVDRHAEAADGPAKRPGDMHLAREDNASGIWTPPAYWRCASDAEPHGEQPVAVGRQDRARFKIGTHRDEILPGRGSGQG